MDIWILPSSSVKPVWLQLQILQIVKDIILLGATSVIIVDPAVMRHTVFKH